MEQAAVYREPEVAFAGEFAPPPIGATVVPIRLAGPGRIVLRSDGLVASAFHVAQGRVALRALGFFGLIGGAFAVDELILHERYRLLMSLVGVGFAVAAQRWFGASPHDARRPFELAIPRASLERAYEDPRNPGTVMIVVKGFQPAGALHFTPARGALETLAALRAHGVEVR
jgi:hypothetical protein